MKALKLPSLFHKQCRRDMIAVYNLLHLKYDIDYSDFVGRLWARAWFPEIVFRKVFVCLCVCI